MTNDLSIRQQSYRYFLQEAPELLQVLEQELLNLREDYSINKIHTLMRTTHTLKGAAASVGLETIKTVAHSLEDIFKALFNPDLSIDSEVEALLFEGYECLSLPIAAELTGIQINQPEILDRTAAVFAQLQDKLGDCFGQESQIPSSVELGFDVTQSIFEVGVTQRLDELAAAVASANPTAIASLLRTQAEVFQGLAESLGLPGFEAIAQAAIAALDAHPDEVVFIGQIALADFQAGQADVLDGDRTQGGQPSLALQQLAGAIATSTQLTQAEGQGGTGAEEENFSTQDELSWVTSTVDSELDLSELHNPQSSMSELPQAELVNPLLELIWGGETVVDSQMPAQRDLEPPESMSATNLEQENFSPTNVAYSSSQQTSAVPPASVYGSEPEDTVNIPLFQQPQTDNPQTSIPQKDQVSQSPTVRVNVEHLDHLNSAIGELLTNQNRQSLQNEQLQTAIRSLLVRIKQHQQLLGQLQDWSDRLFVDAEQQRIWEWGMGKTLSTPHYPIQNPTLPSSPLSRGETKTQNRFDSLELDRYSEAQLLVQSILEDAVKLAEASEAIDLFAAQSNQTVEKQRRLLTSSREVLIEARMLPLGDIFERFPGVLQQLEALHNKPIALELRGTEVLVDKVVAQKLYGPLLHLIRNAFDHGIESPAVRQQRRKPEKGQIEICAYHQGKALVIEVRDDGQGLDFERIRQRAVECQLVDALQARGLNEAQLTNLLFEPGFSTASGVNDLSGRGIGLDMVRAQLNDLDGSIAVYSQPQQGTTFVLQIPLSLTIAKLLLCKAGNQTYALLTDAIEQILIPQADQIRSWEDGQVLRWGTGDLERLIPVRRLSQTLDYFSPVSAPLVSQFKPLFVPDEQVMPIIVIRSQDSFIGLEVDQLLGEQELVIRPLGAMIVPPSYVYGGSILADGQLTLVLDGAALMQYVFDQQIASRTTRNLASSTSHILASSREQRQLPSQTRTALPASPTLDFRARPEKLILLVDDSITVRQSLALTLQKAGYQVLQAKDGYEAIEQLQQHTNIQLVICDIEMPRMNGFEFLKYRQQDPALANIPVLILTSRSASKHRLIASELGATGYIIKPYLEDKLLKTATEIMERNLLNSASM